MEEQKQTNKLSYSAFGKYFRGFLCMVTFAVFSVSVILVIYAIGYYGKDIIIEPTDSYTDTDNYEIEVVNEMGHILNNINMIEQSDASEDFSILNMSEQAIHYYDIKALYNDDIYVDNIERLSAYEKKEPLLIKDIDLSDYDEMREYLQAEESACDYIYFDESAFIELFEKDGLQNTDYRFSGDFSEDAYFIFENYEVTRKQKVSETTEVTEGVTDEKLAEVTTEAATEEENKEEVIITPYNLTSYAVYDPDHGLFYSTWDDYFSDITSYIYRTEDLTSFLVAAEEEETYYNSLVMPLLKNYNMSLDEVMNDIYLPYGDVRTAEAELEYCTDTGCYYNLRIDDGSSYSNVQEEAEIEAMEIFYRLEMLDNGQVSQTHSDNVPDLEEINFVLDTLTSYPVGTVFWVGFPFENGNMSGLAQRVCGYGWYVANCRILLVVAMISFVLLIIQAIWLLCTTGRKHKGDTEVDLNFFDRWYTEIWAVITAVILCGCTGGMILAVDIAVNSFSVEMKSFYTLLGAMLFGFSFMILTLSFARRIKAHNIWNRSLVVKWVKIVYGSLKNSKSGEEVDIREDGKDKESNIVVEKLSRFWKHCKEKYYNIRGTRKLLIIFVVYLILEFIIVVELPVSPQSVGEYTLAFCVLQIIAFLLVVHVVKDIDKLSNGVKEITQGNLDSKVEIDEKLSVFDDLANGINHIGDGLKNAVETSLKDERMKTELITNVSHDLKTPLTSIINYIDLLKKEEIPGEDAKHYIEVLDSKSQRLKQLTEDLVEAAKATSGNIELEMMPLTFDELMKQALGEFEDKFEKRNLTIIASYPEKPAVVMADGRRLFRIIENVLQNIYKYAMEGTRVYADLARDGDKIVFTLKNMSAAPLNISADELMERFTRGDSSRTTEGSGLGLSIAKDLTRLQNGEFEIQLDGDLFKVIIRFPEHK